MYPYYVDEIARNHINCSFLLQINLNIYGKWVYLFTTQSNRLISDWISAVEPRHKRPKVQRSTHRPL